MVLAVVWAILRISGPGGGSSHAEIARFFADSGDRDRFGAAGWAMGAAGLFFLWFLSGLRVVLRRAEGEPARLVAASSAVALRTGLFPPWFAWAGIVVAVLCFLAIPLFLAPTILLLAWILGASALLWRGARREAAPAAGA